MLILIAGMSGPELFILSWFLVTLALLVVVMLAGFDVIRTHRYHMNKLPEIRRRTLDGEE